MTSRRAGNSLHSCLAAVVALAGCGSNQATPATPAASGDPVQAAPGNVAASASSAPSAMDTAPSGAAPQSSAPPAASSPASGPDRGINDVQAVISANRDRFRACYDQAQKKHPDLEGKFVLRFVLHPDGTLKAALSDPTASQIYDESMTNCAFAVLKTLRFAPSRKGMESTINYPFDFHPKAQRRP